MKTWGSVGIFFFFFLPDRDNRKSNYLIIRVTGLGGEEKRRGRPVNNWGRGVAQLLSLFCWVWFVVGLGFF